ncbi:hypothetical protein ACU4GI_32695 [Cupriavidus basilensis]
MMNDQQQPTPPLDVAASRTSCGARTEATKQDYVIRVYIAFGDCWLSEASDEDEADELPTTSDRDLVARYEHVGEAQAILAAVVKRHPTRAFRLETMAPIGAPAPAMAG